MLESKPISGYNLPHECKPWNRCNFWEPKEVEQ